MNSPDGSSDGEWLGGESSCGDVEQQLEWVRNGEKSKQRLNERQSESNPGYSEKENERILKSTPAKKQKTEGRKMTTAEKITAGMTKAFVDYRERSEEKLLRFEKMRAQEERDYEE